MSYLLDTNVVSELRRAGTPRFDPLVSAWFADIPPVLLFVSVLTLGELEQGVLAKERSDPEQGAALRRWLDGSVVPTFAGRVLDVTADAARRAARLRVPDPRPWIDSLIAGTALVHGARLVTRNVVDFDGLGLEVIDPWRGQG